MWGEILAYVFSGHQHEAFLRLKEFLEPFGITQLYGWMGSVRTTY